MSSRKTTLFYAVLIAVASLAVGMVLAARLDLAPRSDAQSLAVPSVNSAPLGGPVDATTFRSIAKAASPFVVNIRTQSKQRAQSMSEFFGGGDMFDRFFGNPQGRGGGRPLSLRTLPGGCQGNRLLGAVGWLPRGLCRLGGPAHGVWLFCDDSVRWFCKRSCKLCWAGCR